jgi:hypothetical protein
MSAARGKFRFAALDPAPGYLNDAAAALRAADLGVRSVPAVAIDGRLVDCCRHTGIDPDALRQAGLGSPRLG